MPVMPPSTYEQVATKQHVYNSSTKNKNNNEVDVFGLVSILGSYIVLSKYTT
jgi:hypothetical protein